MKIFVGQIYIEAGINYPFSHHFQRWLSHELSTLISSSQEFDRKYPEFNLVFNMSAKAELVSPLIKGPTVFKRSKDVEFSVFLPYLKHDPSNPSSLSEPLKLFLGAIANILQSLGVDASQLMAKSGSLVEHIMADPEMFKNRRFA